MEENDVVENLDIELLAEAMIEDECANDPDPDTIIVEDMEVEGASE